tara:strand:+ start:3610 stop:3744 length:135 start_codon:yes stop_codon:yes gene_type:complete
METQKRKVSNAFSIGQQITKNDFKTLTDNYLGFDDSSETPFLIN